jgi:hypothetical protein
MRVVTESPLKEHTMNRKPLRPVATAMMATGLAISIGLASPLALAQAAPSDQELQQFVAASKEVHKISATSDAQIKAAKSTEEAAKLDDAASEKMEAAVHKQGLTTDRYTEIYTVMQKDDKVKARVAELAKK